MSVSFLGLQIKDEGPCPHVQRGRKQEVYMMLKGNQVRHVVAGGQMH